MLFLGVSLAVLLLDQVSKMLIINSLVYGQSIPVAKNIFHITYIHNPGAAFGLLANHTSLFIVVSVLVIAGVIIFYYKQCTGNRAMSFALGLILGGAAGNLLDRGRYGSVVDFLDFMIWPVFNLADSAIVVGCCLMILTIWRMERGS